MRSLRILGLLAVTAVLALAGCDGNTMPPAPADGPLVKGSRAPSSPGEEETTSGANLSFPAIWSEDVSKSPRGAMGTVQLGGAWWWWWGEAVDDNSEPLACKPDPDDPTMCDDGIPGQATGSAPGSGAVKVYLQRDALNEWQADNANGGGRDVVVDWIDWGDALEAVPWSLTSKVRIETTLLEEVTSPMTGYTMRHLYGHGMDEMWGVETGGGQAVTVGNSLAIIYSTCARLTIQKLSVTRDQLEPRDARLTWDPVTHLWKETDPTGGDLVSNDAIFNSTIAPEGPAGGLGAEINIQGKVVYGLTWDVKTMNQGAGDYRITFSLGDDNCVQNLRTFIQDATQIILADDEEGDDGEPGLGGVAVIDGTNNLTYIDVRIGTSRGGRGGGGNGGGGNGGSGGRSR